MKDEHIKRTWLVTVSLPCEVCAELKPAKELEPKSSYVYGEGWLKRSQCCQACFDKERAEMAARVKSNEWTGEGY